MKTLVLGATGYVGHPVAAALVAAGDTVSGLVRSTARAAALRVVELRFASFVHGRGGSVFVPALIAAARRDGRSYRVGAGEARVSAVHVDALPAAVLGALERGVRGGVYHVASDDEPRVADLAEAVGIATGTPVEEVDAETAAAALDPFTAMFLQTGNRLDSRLARRELGWSGAHAHGLLWDVAHGSYA